MHYTSGVFALLTTLAVATAPALPQPAPQPPAVVHIANFAFVPAKLAIDAGQTVRFVNDDAEPHTVTARDASFDSTGLDANDSWQHAFAHAGTFAYYCQLHPMMTGTIVVRPSGAKP